MKLITILSVLLMNQTCAQDTELMVKQVDDALASGKTDISEVLSDEKFMSLHPETSFREVIKKHARAEKVTMVCSGEPGTKITVRGKVTNNGQPIQGALVYLYQTSDKGWYAANTPHVSGNEGDMRHARLFTYLVTNIAGEFEIVTIRPRGYPNSDLPAHIHIAIWKDGQYLHGIPGELLFDDDERLTPERKQRSTKEGFVIAKNTGTASTPVYQYNISMAKPALTFNDRLVNFILPVVERNLSRQWISQWFLFLMI